MCRLPKFFGLGLLALAFLVGSGVTQDAKKDEKKAKGTLPPGFKDLGLTAEQKVKIYAVIGEFKTKIVELDKQIRELKKTESQEIFKILTDDQKKKYLEAKGVDSKATTKDPTKK